MLQLTLIRHAKSDWNEPALSDFERPLNARGMRDAPHMGKVLQALNLKPDIILSSPATRAITSARLIGAELGYVENNIVTVDDLYNAPVARLLEQVQHIQADIQSAVVVAHNPGISEFCTYLCDAGLGGLPTCAAVHIEFDLDDWQAIHSGSGKLGWYEYPKK